MTSHAPVLARLSTCFALALLGCQGAASTPPSASAEASTSYPASAHDPSDGAPPRQTASTTPPGASADASAERTSPAALPPPPPTSTIPAAILSMDGPKPRDADASREAVIEALRPKVVACTKKHGGSSSGAAGRVRVVVRLGKGGKVAHVDLTASGSVTRAAIRCAQEALQGSIVPVAPDTPPVVSFVVLLPER